MSIREIQANRIRFVKPAYLITLFVFLLLAVPKLDANKLGYALSGGGARGFAQIGILKVLEENGIYPDYISGTSMGALIGGLYALGYSAQDIENILVNIDVSEILKVRFKRHDLYIGEKRWAPYGNLVLEMDDRWSPRLPSGIYASNKLNLELARMFLAAAEYPDFESFPIPFVCIATDLVTGEPVVFRDGSLMQAIRASISVPSLIEPLAVEPRLYIDGGISQNLPAPILRESGVDRVLGIKVNSALRTREQLVDLVDVIDQTINIGITQNLDEGRNYCDLLIDPLMEEYSSTDFKKIRKIIDFGEAYAREHLDQILSFKQALVSEGYVFNKPPERHFENIYKIVYVESRGNQHVSTAKVRDYLGLERNEKYSVDELIAASETAWNSQIFKVLYPVLKKTEKGYRLIIHQQESPRKHLLFNTSYTTEEKLNVGAVLQLNNMLLKNSKLQTGLTLGGRTEVNLDVVKNFGDLWGAYFRLFPYLSEHRLYFYDDNGDKQSSVKSLEFGFTPGVGLFARDIAIAEGFFYTYRTKQYRDVSTVAPDSLLYLVSGLGIKAYHESLDDFYFPMRGTMAFAKCNFARWSSISHKIYSRLESDFNVYSPITSYASLRLGFSCGSYFGTAEEDYGDPFYFSGSHGYSGYERYEKSSPQYSYFTLGTVISPYKNVYLQTGLQGLDLQKGGIWKHYSDLECCFYAELGLNTIAAPIRLLASWRHNSKPKLYLNVGYDIDPFWFSRK